MMLIFYVKTIQTDVYKLLPIPLLRLLLQYDTNEKIGTLSKKYLYIIFNCFQLLHEIHCVHVY